MRHFQPDSFRTGFLVGGISISLSPQGNADMPPLRGLIGIDRYQPSPPRPIEEFRTRSQVLAIKIGKGRENFDCRISLQNRSENLSLPGTDDKSTRGSGDISRPSHPDISIAQLRRNVNRNCQKTVSVNRHQTIRFTTMAVMSSVGLTPLQNVNTSENSSGINWAGARVLWR